MKSPKTIRLSIALAAAMLGGLAGVAAAQITGDVIATSQGDLVIHPIDHATFVMGWNGKAIYVDPVGGADRFAGLPAPDLILVTDIHGDHMNAETLEAIVAPQTTIIAPAAVAGRLPASLTGQTISLANGETSMLDDIGVEGVPMYNLTQDRLRFHDKGRGNGILHGRFGPLHRGHPCFQGIRRIICLISFYV